LASAVAWMTDTKSGQALTRLLAGRGPQIAAVVLLLLLALDSALMLTHVFDQPSALPPVSASPPAGALRPSLNPELQLAVILNSHLFGLSSVTSSGEVRDTNIPLVLAGVIAGKDPGKGQAIIGQNATAAKLYAVGAAIPGGARLHEVYSDHVILERNGGLEALRLPRNMQATQGAPTAPAPAARAAAGAASGNASLLAGLVRVQPVFNQGKLTGYRIFPGGGKGTAAFTQLGLKPGDLIQAVNGTPLDDAGRAMEVLQTLSSSAVATVTVSRNGQPQEVNLNMASVNLDPDTDAGAAASPTDSAAPNAAPSSTPNVGVGRFRGGNMGAMPGTPPANPGNINAAPGGADAPSTPDRER
jgi:general secretion pathway protein C